MLRHLALLSLALVPCSFLSACDAVLGSVDVAPPQSPSPVGGEQPGTPPVSYPPPGVGTTSPFPPVTPAPSAGAGGSAPDAGPELPGSESEPDAAVSNPPESTLPDASPPEVTPPVDAPRPVVADGPASTLERVGVDGGGPRLGACERGFVIGVRPTANPSTDVFGQRIVFLEPICGTARSEDTLGGIQVSRDDSVLRWDVSGEFLGEPSFEVPDDRLVWVPQPETLCPDTAPALVGLSGEYDPVAPDATDTAAIRSLVIECAPLFVADDGVVVAADTAGRQLISRADSFAGIGTDTYRSVCDGGTVITQFQIDAGFWLDGFVLGCSALRSPFAAGAACSGDYQCQSGFCAADSLCSL